MDLIERLRGWHQRHKTDTCGWCDEPWPCDMTLLLDVAEAARVARLTNAGKGYPDSEADVVLDAALARLESTDARE